MKFNDIKFGDKFVGKYSGVTIVVTGKDSMFRGGEGGGAIFAMNEESDKPMAYRFDTFFEYYESFVEFHTLCQRFVAGYDKKDNRRAIWLEYDAATGDVMSLTVESNGGTPERLCGVPQLPDVGSTVRNLAEWVAKAQTSDSILFYD